jgi:hypothetical protein
MEEETPMKGESEGQDPFQTTKSNTITTPHPSSTMPKATVPAASVVVAVNEEEELKKTIQP